jgi:hypothetical protein
MKTVNEIADINETLSVLSKSALREIRDFAFYLADREKRRKAFEKEVLNAEQETPIRFKTVKDAMKAIRDEAGI